MNKARADKVEKIEVVKAKIDGSTATLVTEYRGLTVAEMASLRRTLRTVGGDYKVFKNTLVRRAISGSDYEPLNELLVGPTAIAFVEGDVSAVAKALRDFAKGAPALILKGGVLDGKLIGSKELGALADLPTRDVLLAQFAGALAAPMRQMAGLLKAVPQNFAYGLQALLDSKGGAPVPEAPAEAAAEEAPAEAAAEEAPAEAAAEEAPAEAAAEEAPAEAAVEEAPAEAAAGEADAEAAVEEAPAEAEPPAAE
jgi:large subunit ribosomal protein L10